MGSFNSNTVMEINPELKQQPTVHQEFITEEKPMNTMLINSVYYFIQCVFILQEKISTAWWRCMTAGSSSISTTTPGEAAKSHFKNCLKTTPGLKKSNPNGAIFMIRIKTGWEKNTNTWNCEKKG